MSRAPYAAPTGSSSQVHSPPPAATFSQMVRMMTGALSSAADTMPPKIEIQASPACPGATFL